MKPSSLPTPEPFIYEDSLPDIREHLARKFRSRRWLISLTTIPLVLGLGVWQWRSTIPLNSDSPSLPVEVMTVNLVNAFSLEREYSGEIVAQRRSALGFDQAGQVVAILVQEGDTVSGGQPLARLDTRSLDSQKRQLVAQKAQAQALLQELQNGARPQAIAAARAAVQDLEQQVALAKVQRERRADLYEQGAISREELDQQAFGLGALQNRMRQAESVLAELLAGTRPEKIAAQLATIQQIEANIQSIEIERDKAMIKAPFPGRIAKRLLDEGFVVSHGQPILELVEGSVPEARIGVPTTVAETLVVGRDYPVEVAGVNYIATLTALLPTLEVTSRTVTAVLKLETSPPIIFGQTARLRIEQAETTRGVWLPSQALVQADSGLWAVYVTNQSESGQTTVTRQPIQLLHTAGEKVFVTGLIQGGDQVVASGVHRLVPGQAVEILQP